MEDDMWVENNEIRWLIIDSQTIISINKTPTSEIYDPNEEIIFHEI